MEDDARITNQVPKTWKEYAHAAVTADSAQWIATAARKPEMMIGNATMTECGAIPAAVTGVASAVARRMKLTLTYALGFLARTPNITRRHSGLTHPASAI